MKSNEPLTWYRPRNCTDDVYVEVARRGDEYLMRSSEHPEKFLMFTTPEWEAFIAGVNDGEFRFPEEG